MITARYNPVMKKKWALKWWKVAIVWQMLVGFNKVFQLFKMHIPATSLRRQV